MKLKLIMMLFTLGVLSVVPLIMMGKFDPMAFFDLGFSRGASEFSKLKAQAPKNLTSVVTDKKVQVYKWRDEHGVMQFSNVPPATDRDAEQVVLDPASNLVQAVKVPEKKEAPKAAGQTQQRPNPYSVKGMKKVMDDAKGIEALLQKRQAQQQKALGNL